MAKAKTKAIKKDKVKRERNEKGFRILPVTEANEAGEHGVSSPLVKERRLVSLTLRPGAEFIQATAIVMTHLVDAEGRAAGGPVASETINLELNGDGTFMLGDGVTAESAISDLFDLIEEQA